MSISHQILFVGIALLVVGFEEFFVCGLSTGSAKGFFCTICHREGSVESRVVSEVDRLFFRDQNSQEFVTHQIHQGVLNAR